MTTTPAPGSLEAECPGGLGWAFYGLGECIRTTRDKVSITFGVMSIMSWFLFAIPQMVTNCVKKIPDEAVSPWLLIFWLVGDSLNLIGAFLTHQLFLQKVLAGYTVAVDLLLIAQFMYYKIRHRNKLRKYGLDYNKSEEINAVDTSSRGSISSDTKKTLATVLLGVIGLSAFYSPSALNYGGETHHLPQANLHGRRLLQAAGTTTTRSPLADFLSTRERKIGYAIGWIGAFMYFCSRAPQIFQNFKRKSTEGLSPYLFLLAILGNVFYGLQIFIKSTDAAFILTALPWILGSLGILVFDAIILGQFIAYRNNRGETDKHGDLDDDDFQRQDEKITPDTL
ncbi:hypothetical protein AAHC03_09082 [Spirometra sp. Aus1]